ncbi:class 1 fructose-bisphosphatase [Chloroflexi bacterium TSY]|nr:class 1 fructose-bisphosphatase [Chloroflexi bacterium TSY]
MSNKIVTIERYILEQQEQHPEATGDLTQLLYDLALAAKFIANRTTRAGLAEIIRSNGKGNVQDEELQTLNQFAERTIHRLNDHTGRLAVMASEEQPHIIPIPERYGIGKYVLLYDPLDGVSNIDYNVSIGTIFAIYRRQSEAGPGTLDDCLQKGRNLVAAGYVIYGSSTMLVYSTGQGVHGFTLNPSIGEFLLSHPNIRIPASPRYYSTNQGHYSYWSKSTQNYTRWLQGTGREKPLSSRYIGSLVADVHRNLLSGGVFYYPADSRNPQLPHGKLHLLFEAAPLAFMAEQAGGYASDGTQPILDIEPHELHQRVPFYVGNRDLVEKAEEFEQQDFVEFEAKSEFAL